MVGQNIGLRDVVVCLPVLLLAVRERDHIRVMNVTNLFPSIVAKALSDMIWLVFGAF
jgi:hypothetical protein